ncbi:hypothetical protein [Pseudomonas sp. Gutcm_11s]|uniref:hypothetical protein n=1 Tax=Pseudomonas sp. Gutcm_11s TaxID=3026088 RepID=UPI0023626F18|nr:hypothetical protein [Pseudomonas sp. Gutcm_11s]MDD0844796.1 hypothetical protein [Pseudomonas sp. Gutcm_11s]
MKKWQWISLVSFLLLAALAWLWLRDEPLLADARAWLQAPPAAAESVAYYQLLGLDAPAGQDPQAAGRQLLDAHRQWRAEHGFSDLLQPAAAAERIELPAGLCALGEPGCLQQLRDNPAQLAGLLARHAELRQRYENLLAQSDYRTLSQPSMDEPLANYTSLDRANRLLAAQALVLAEGGLGAAGLALLQQDVRQLREWLGRADNLILKMMLVRLLAADLDAIAVLHDAGLLPRPAAQPALSEAERSLQGAMQREFALVGFGLMTLLDNPQTASELGVLRWQLRWLYKPQMTVNDSLPAYRRVANASQLDTAAFVRSLQSPARAEPSLWRRVRNPLGAILGQVATPDFNQYLARLHDLDAKLVLFNALGQAVPEVDNPYRADQRASWDAKRQAYCFAGPLADKQGLRCLPWTPPAAS